MHASGIITLVTDFGLGDAYVAVMKGVILSINAGARLIDVTHDIKQGAIVEAADILQEAFHFFPRGSVHLVVVDPGVGSSRRSIALKAEGHFFVGPDNGLFWPIFSTHKESEIFHLTRKEYFLPDVSYTFHGRDIFAPVAAYLSLGVEPGKMGEPVTDPVPLDRPQVKWEKGRLSGRAVRVDHFGNVITNIRSENLKSLRKPEQAVVKIGPLVIRGIRETYSDAKAGDLLALLGSSGRLEIAVNLGRACDRLGADSGRIIGMEVLVLDGEAPPDFCARVS